MNDALGDRMKLYESAEAGRRFMPLLPIMARVDGRAFHSFAKGLKRPFDPILTADEIEALPEKHHARQNPGLVIERSRIMVLEMPPLATVINREEVIFEGAEPTNEKAPDEPRP